jgi:hypothetical protein
MVAESQSKSRASQENLPSGHHLPIGDGQRGKNERELAENPVICLDANCLIAGTSDERPESAHLLRWIDGGETFCTPQSTFKPSPPL